MTNCEKYAEILRDFGTTMFGVDKLNLIPKRCLEINCDDCLLNNPKYSCSDERVDWLITEPFEHIDLTHGVIKVTAKEKTKLNRPDIIIKKYDSLNGMYDMTEIYKND